APMKGLDTVPRENWPEVAVAFWAFRIMVGLGVLMVALGLYSLFLRWRGTLYESKPMHWFAMAMGPAGFAAVLAGWTVTETGRQPYTVYGLLRTIDSASPIAAHPVTFSRLAFAIVYFVVFAMGTYYILHLMAAPPHLGEEGLSEETPTHAAGITALPPVHAAPAPKGGS